MSKAPKEIKTKNTEDNDETNLDDELLVRQSNKWKSYSNSHNEIREDIRLDSYQKFNDEYGRNKENDLVCEQEDLTEDYLDSLSIFE
ncbi:hypothetical protein [Crocosphaera chwakensis]|uniref:Uncharacterized protein n=1 Tax=Crocosphaera chwakensis CCY0110 TaxID=391612 RepID=A3IZ70_9CHRO|nr:hypothetical protein [Crocosphaera chwakensis]EAZ88240.1 hypothetical protein CY0110_01290 [Crocosphaera chwakensis CCY0110]